MVHDPLQLFLSLFQPPFVMLPLPRPKRCATHLFIAHLIHYQKQLQRPFWHPAGSAALYGARPYNMNILPPSDALLLGSSVIGNPNLSANNNLGSGSLVTSNGHNLKEKAPNTHADAHRKQYMPTQTAPQVIFRVQAIIHFERPRLLKLVAIKNADLCAHQEFRCQWTRSTLVWILVHFFLQDPNPDLYPIQI